MHAYRSHTCAQLSAENVGESVRLSGWVHRKRDHGGVLFVDLRDHYGITQIVADEDSPALEVFERLRAEFYSSMTSEDQCGLDLRRDELIIISAKESNNTTKKE